MVTLPGKNYVMPESLDDIVKTLDRSRPTFTMLYFSASWNPKCAEIEQDYLNMVSKNSAYTHIRVDCDKHFHLKRYFDARVEPSFLFLVNGGEIHRQIGYNFEKIDSLCEQVV